MNYVIVQAGGKGTRMKSLTANKPKALVPVNNLPIIFHLFRKFPDKHFVIIGDYKADVLEKYLDTFADVDFTMIHAGGREGTCSGIKEALNVIPVDEQFLLIWCDLVLPDDFKMPESPDNYIGISKDFPCRWKYEKGEFYEERSEEFGVAGFFIFKNKEVISDVPEEGEFVRWLKNKDLAFKELPLYRTQEYGLKSEWDKLPVSKCRPFNKTRIEGDKFYKIPIDEQGKTLANREAYWYKKIQNAELSNLPHIYNYEPLCMERIDGDNIYKYDSISVDKKRDVLKQIVSLLKKVHEIGTIPSNRDSYYEAYIGKTFDRLDRIKELVPFAEDEYITINGRSCRNAFFCREDLEQAVMEYFPSEFKFIHGDCTFSNIMLKKNGMPVLIDPRGYFGTTALFGDAAYDWAKLYYSLYSNYDRFNLKRFELDIGERDVRLSVESNKWESLEEDFFNYVGDEIDYRQMKILLAVIWLSLTTYTWEDYDSICGAFYKGTYYLEEALDGDSI